MSIYTDPLYIELRRSGSCVEDAMADTMAAIIVDLTVAARQALPIIDAHRRMAGGEGDVTAQVLRHAIRRAEGAA